VGGCGVPASQQHPEPQVPPSDWQQQSLLNADSDAGLFPASGTGRWHADPAAQQPAGVVAGSAQTVSSLQTPPTNSPQMTPDAHRDPVGISANHAATSAAKPNRCERKLDRLMERNQLMNHAKETPPRLSGPARTP